MSPNVPPNIPSDNRALLVLSLRENGLGTKEAGRVLGEMLKVNSVLKELDLTSNSVAAGSGGDAPGFAQELAAGIKDNGTLSVLSLKNNGLGTKEAGKVLGGMLKENSVLKELDLSENMYYSSGWKIDPEFAEELAAGIKDNGAMTRLTFGGDEYNTETNPFAAAKWVTPEPATLEVSMTEADLGNKNLGVGGAIIISAWLTHKDNGAMTSLNLASNSLGQIALPAGWRSKFNDGLAPWVGPNGQQQSAKPVGKPEGIIAIANAIPDMGALTSLNLSWNHLKAKGAKIFVEAMKVTNFAIASFWHHFHSHLTTA
jgi:hypothetical protein